MEEVKAEEDLVKVALLDVAEDLHMDDHEAEEAEGAITDAQALQVKALEDKLYFFIKFFIVKNLEMFFLYLFSTHLINIELYCLFEV